MTTQEILVHVMYIGLKTLVEKDSVTLHYLHVSWNFPFRCLDLLALEAGLFNPTLLAQILSYDMIQNQHLNNSGTV